MQDWRSGYSKKYLGNFNIICYDSRIFVPKIFIYQELYWYHLYINHPGGGIISIQIQQVCYWDLLVIQEDISVKPFYICKQFKTHKI